MGEGFWKIEEGPNQWAATLRWLCFSHTTLPLAAREANRMLRQLSLGGPASLRAGLDFAFEVCSLPRSLLHAQDADSMPSHSACCQFLLLARGQQTQLNSRLTAALLAQEADPGSIHSDCCQFL